MPEPLPLVEARNLSVRFPGEARDALRAVTLSLADGETVGIVGPSGSGKSTLALALVGAIPALIPARLDGEVQWSAQAAATLACGTGLAAFVQQDVDAQLVALSVEGEIAFALENRGLAAAAIDARIAQALAAGPACGLKARDQTLQLSTGWRQRLALAAATAEEARLTVLDEPTAHLDEAAAVAAIAHLARAVSGALLLVEHRSDLLCEVADRLVLLDRDGTLLAQGPPALVLATIGDRPDLGLRLPPAARAAQALREAGLWQERQLAFRGRDLMASAAIRTGGVRACRIAAAAVAPPLPGVTARGPTLLALETVALRRSGRGVLDDMSLSIRAGEIVGVSGPNGSGKTSLALVAAGALRPSSGTRLVHAKRTPVFVPQDPALAFATPSLGAEAARRDLAWPDAAEALLHFRLVADPLRHPLRHSRGEVRRLALAFALARGQPPVVVLDEPTAGLDAHGLDALETCLARHAESGGGALVISHDLDWLSRVARHILVLERGRIRAQGDGPALCARALDGDLPIAAPPGAALAAALGWCPGRRDAR